MTELKTFESDRLSIRESENGTIIEIFHHKEEDRSGILQFIRALVNLLMAPRREPEYRDETPAPLAEETESETVSEQIKYEWWTKHGDHFLRNVDRSK